MGGVTNNSIILNDFWEYDIATATWTQKPNFPGPERYGAVSFVLGNLGYIATGGNDFGYLDDMWQYDPTTGIWLQKTGLPVGSAQHENQRVEAFAFVIGNSVYLGGGQGFVFGANSTNNIAFYDLWEFSTATNSWTPKATIPDFLGRNMSVAAAVNNKGYVGLGTDINQTVNRQSFWEYDPVADAWTMKADFPGNYTTDTGPFVLNNNIYITGGVRFSPIGTSGQFYRYDPVTDTWTQLPAFNGGAIVGHFTCATATSAFAGGGYNGSFTTRNDFWEYTTATGLNDHTPDNEAAAVFPNPTSGELYIQSSKNIASIQVTDPEGKIILNRTYKNGSTDISEVQDGIYFVKIFFADGETAVQRIVKAD